MAEAEGAPRSRATLEPLLEAFQRRLDAAAAQGAGVYDREFERPPAGAGVHEIDTGKVFRRISGGGLEILGYSAAELLGKRVLDFIVMRESSERAIDRKITGSAELRPFVRSFVRKDGSSVTLLMLDRHLRSGKGAPVGLRTVYAPVDLTA
jgi:PAS domain S-box-containing protein